MFDSVQVIGSDIDSFIAITDEIAGHAGEIVTTDAERFSLMVRFTQTALIVKETKAPPAGPFAAILGSHQRPPAPAEKPSIVLRDFIGINTQAQLADIRRWAPDADDDQIREWAVDSIYYQLEPSVTESEVDRQINIIRNTYGYDVTEAQLLAIGIDQLHYEWSANAKGH